MQLALWEMPDRRVGPGLLLAGKNRLLASRTSGGLIWRHTETHAFLSNRRQRPSSKSKDKLARWEEDGVRPVEHM